MFPRVRSRTGAALTALTAVGCLALAGLASASPQAATPAKPAKAAIKVAAPAVSQNPQDYAGEETCLTCHEAQTKGYHGSPHGQKWNEKSPAATKGCESCHGPGKAHAEAGGDKTKINPLRSGAQASAACTTCHAGKTHMLWAGSQHDQRNVSCITCHSVHDAKGPKQLKAANEITLCATCHKPITNKQNRFNHMPVREGKLTCSSCHNVHGSQNIKLLRVGTTTDESCVSCHADKRGPVLWEHAPVSESCTTCHDPHGSNNDRMLVAKQPYLCQRCHVTARHPPTVYDHFIRDNSTSGNKVYGRSCVVCHQQIHGSNSPNGKAFLR